MNKIKSLWTAPKILDTRLEVQFNSRNFYISNNFFISFSNSSALVVGSNLATTFPDLSTKNLVKFHFISDFLAKSESFFESISVNTEVSLCLGSNPENPFSSFKYLKSGIAFSPLTSTFANWSNLTL